MKICKSSKSALLNSPVPRPRLAHPVSARALERDKQEAAQRLGRGMRNADGPANEGAGVGALSGEQEAMAICAPCENAE